ncbi:hypothetical protein WDU94_012261, partial [Cyamophila willieti]
VLRISPVPTNENTEDIEGARLEEHPNSTAPSHSSNATQSFYHWNNNTTNLNPTSLSTPTLNITSLNIEGISATKEELLADMCRDQNINILVMQETHRGPQDIRPKINGMMLVNERAHDKYGSAIFVNPNVNIISSSQTCHNNIEILTIEIEHCTITSVYKPPGEVFTFNEPQNFRNKETCFVLGDFNCHSITWGYADTDSNGESLERWAESQDLKLLHDPKLPPSFNSRRWNRGYNPDLIFTSCRIANQCTKIVLEAIPGTQHRPIACELSGVVKPENVPFKRRFNFKRARWEQFSEELDREIESLEPVPKNYDLFVELTKKISRKHIPRGCRTQYIPGLSNESKQALVTYQHLYEQDPFSEDTIEAGDHLLQMVSASRTEKWCSLVESLDLKQNSRRAWKLLKNLNQDKTAQSNQMGTVTPDQIAHQLLINGKTASKPQKIKIKRQPEQENNFLEDAFNVDELNKAIDMMKNNKAAGLDDIRTEQLKNFGRTAREWLVHLMNNCLHNMEIPKLWRKTRVVALLKPGKDPQEAKSYRPISLLCHLYKILERMILNRIADPVDQSLIPEQTGFRPGKSCCSQVLNLAQHIEDGFERKEITGVAFVDLTAAYDTVNHKRLISKVFQITKDFKFMQFVQCIMRNRRFYVTLGNKKSRWRLQKNGLAQGSVLAPVLFNMYTNDQPIHPETRQFTYADDTAIAGQGTTFEEVEGKVTRALDKLALYYENNQLKPNPSKTEVCAFHLKNAEAQRKLKISWKGQELHHNFNPKYLGVTLDRALTYKTHCINTKKKVCSRNAIIRKLTGTSWGAKPHVLRTSTLALCVSAAEYAAPVWRNSSHAHQVDVALNEAARIITGCLKPTPVDRVYQIAGIAPPNIRRRVAAETERLKQTADNRHPLFNHNIPRARLKSRRNFFMTTEPINTHADIRKSELWRYAVTQPLFDLKEEPPPGSNLPYPTWKSLNRLRSGVSRCKTNLRRWGYTEDATCECGETQTHAHLLTCNQLDYACTQDDLAQANERAVQTARFWEKQI